MTSKASRKRSRELFPTDKALTSEEMIGRADDVRELATTLALGGNVVVAGPRRTGKTSVCTAALTKAAEEEDCYTVAVDLFRVSSVEEFAETLVINTVANRSALRRVIQQSRRAGRLVVDSTLMTVAMKSKTELGDELEIAFEPGLARRDPDRYLEYALSLPGRIAEVDKKTVIVFFDEFQEVGGSQQPFGDPDRLTKKMRAIFQRSRGTSYLFAGSIEHLMRDLFTPSHRAFSQFGSFCSLRDIPHITWKQGLRERFEADQCEVSRSALDRLVDLGEGHPRATMLIAQKTHLASVLSDTQVVDAELVEQGFAAALEGDRASNEQTVERIRQSHKLAIQIAERIANGNPIYPNLPRGAVPTALEKLRLMGLVERGSNNDWKITDPIVRRYLQRLSPLAM